jgi:purine-binding chemotaxis protein CheW
VQQRGNEGSPDVDGSSQPGRSGRHLDTSVQISRIIIVVAEKATIAVNIGYSSSAVNSLCSPIAALTPGLTAMFAGARTAPSTEGVSRRSDNPIIQLVGFRLDNEDYAIAITKIQEIILMKPITRIPQVPDFIEGLINLRGSVIPIVNLRKRFGLHSREVDDETRTIVVNIQEKTVGCIVDAVTQVMRINRDQIQPPPLSVLVISHQYIAGLARLDDRLLIILDIERLFEDQSQVVSGPWIEKEVDPQGLTDQKK